MISSSHDGGRSGKDVCADGVMNGLGVHEAEECRKGHAHVERGPPGVRGSLQS